MLALQRRHQGRPGDLPEPVGGRRAGPRRRRDGAGRQPPAGRRPDRGVRRGRRSTEFVLSGYPHLEEAYRFGEGVLPEPRRGAGRLGRTPAPADAVSGVAQPSRSARSRPRPPLERHDHPGPRRVSRRFPTNQDLDPARLRQAFGIFPSGVVAVAAEVDGRLSAWPRARSPRSAWTRRWSRSRSPTRRRPGPTCAGPPTSASRCWPTTTARSPPAGRPGRAPLRRRGRDRSPSDGAVTLVDGLARFDTTIYREVEAGDHTIVLLRLHAVEHADTSSPLVFHRSGFGSISR